MAFEGAADPAPLPEARLLYDDAPCGLLVTSIDGTIQRVNHTFCRWIGYDTATLVGQMKFQDLLTMGGRIFHQTHWAPLLQMQGSVAEVKLEVAHRDGRKLPMVINAMRRAHSAVALHEIACFLAEDRHKYERELMLARRRAEELLAKEREAQQALRVAQAERDHQRAMAEDRALFAEQMIGIVSHDLRNPLTVIRMSAQLLGRGDLSSNQLAMLGRMTSSVSRADRMIVDLLDFTQARLGRGLQIVRKPLDLHAMVSECVEELQLAFPRGRLEHHASGSGSCVASSDRLAQMIGNLVANAFTYGALDHPVIVKSSIESDAFSVSVHNQGDPIPERLLPKLFEPMTRGDSTSKGHSVGLGLYIVREIARAHGGEVTVVSSPQFGTTFSARFPRSAG